MKLAKIREFLIPVHRSEMKRFVPMTGLFFLVALVYNLLRPLKIALVVAAPESGAEVIPFLKVWGILPGAIFFTYLFTLLSKRLTREYVFYTMMAIFLSFFFVFATMIYPARESLELKVMPDIFGHFLPLGAKGFIAMFRYWFLSIFYLFSELWGSVIFSMLLWGFINETTELNTAKRLYPIFALSANLGAISAGKVGMILSKTPFFPALPFGKTSWEQSIAFIISTVLMCGCVIIFLFWILNRQRGVQQDAAETLEGSSLKGSEKPHFTLRECLHHVLSSRYLSYLAVIVICYNLVFNLTDILWTSQLKLRFQNDTGALNSFMSQITIIKGSIATVSALFVTGNVVRVFGWFVGAVVTPSVILLTSLLFFPFLLFDEVLMVGIAQGVFSMTLLQAAVFFGSFQNCLTRAAKYTVFDATKEMVYIPLSKDEQRKGKATIDGIGSRFGKSGGSIISQALLMMCTSITATAPYVAGIVFSIVFVWIFAVYGLHKEMKRRSRDISLQQSS